MDRRTFLIGVAITAAVESASGLGNTSDVADSLPCLKRKARAAGMLYGASAVSGGFKNDSGLATAFRQQCGILVPDWQLKWIHVRPTPTTYNFSDGDWLLNFADSYQMAFRGHTLVWHQGLPSWFGTQMSKEGARLTLTQYIAKVMGHYAGKVHSWDVVNEPIAMWDKNPGGLRNSPWLDMLGPDYIEIAFRAARQADSKTLLVLNQNHLEYEDDEGTRTATLNLLRKLKSKNVPIDALGMQAHLVANQKSFSAIKLTRFLNEVSAMGLKILITEMDVTDKYVSGTQQQIDQAVADEYARFLAPVLDNKSVMAVLTWGLSDKYSWLNSYGPRSDGRPVRPLPLDANMNPKPAFHAIANAFDHAAKR